MGEYIKLYGEPYKIGTCENLYYIRFADLAELVRLGHPEMQEGNHHPRVYLKDNSGFRFRFPFPDEDRPTMRERLDLYQTTPRFDRGLMIPYPAHLRGEDHYTVDYTVTSGSFTAILRGQACPYSKPVEDGAQEWQITLAPLHIRGLDVAELVFQRLIDGQLWPVFRCPWCGSMWRTDEEDTLTLARHVEDQVNRYPVFDETRDEIKTAMQRMTAGFFAERWPEVLGIPTPA